MAAGRRDPLKAARVRARLDGHRTRQPRGHRDVWTFAHLTLEVERG